MGKPIYLQMTENWTAEERSYFPESSFHHLSATGSTNDDLSKLLKDGDGGNFTLVVADFQDSGRGRRGDRWEAAAGRNLLFSVAIALGENREHWTRIPLETAMVVGEALESVLEPGTRIEAKWPNDIFLQGRKLGGILVETILNPGPYAIIGVGLNINVRREEIPAELHDIAISLYEVLECESSRWYILELIMRNWIELKTNKDANFEEVIDWLRNRDFLKGKPMHVQMSNGEIQGKGAGFGDRGELLVEIPNGEVKSIVSAEKISLC
ncbi:MAG: biotin--[acetyl-CoA-carboxylase] ligase [Verrucomicrobiales bacterium]|nr:biotin--[acetyl-CoA-carboxylase] ligase [Verrucomicrobiales bacterium]